MFIPGADFPRRKILSGAIFHNQLVNFSVCTELFFGQFSPDDVRIIYSEPAEYYFEEWSTDLCQK